MEDQSRIEPQLVPEETIETHTGSLHDPKRGDLPFALTMPYGRDPHAAPNYLAVPREFAQVQTRHQLPLWAWRVELHLIGDETNTMGLDILGPVILGRTAPRDVTVDVDFTPYDAMNRGVSRRHALIRPTEEHLYLIDLSSTNGTRRNEVPLGAGIAVSLHDRDTIALGDLTFQFRILHCPDPAQSPQHTDDPIHDTQPMKVGLQPPK